MQHSILPAVLLAALAAPVAAAIEVDFGKCRSVVEPTARLACYDAIPHAVAAPRSPSTAVSAAEAARAGGSSPAAASAVERFGLMEGAREFDAQSIQSRVSADFFGWEPNERIRLDNGQIWQVVDGSSGSVGPGSRKVTVRRGALGSF